jgi:hypothetical protein
MQIINTRAKCWRITSASVDNAAPSAHRPWASVTNPSARRRVGHELASTVVLLSIAAGLAVLQGCAGFIAETREFANGWRSASVVEVAKDPHAIQHEATRDCRDELPSDVAARHSFAVFEYHAGQRHRYLVAPLVHGDTVRVGEVVVINIRDCLAGVRR